MLLSERWADRERGTGRFGPWFRPHGLPFDVDNRLSGLWGWGGAWLWSASACPVPGVGVAARVTFLAMAGDQAPACKYAAHREGVAGSLSRRARTVWWRARAAPVVSVGGEGGVEGVGDADGQGVVDLPEITDDVWVARRPLTASWKAVGRWMASSISSATGDPGVSPDRTHTG